MMQYKYKIQSTGHSSARFGPCDICGQHATEVFSQRELLEYEYPEEINQPLVGDRHMQEGKMFGWTAWGCVDYHGHAACLKNRRRGDNPIVEDK